MGTNYYVRQEPENTSLPFGEWSDAPGWLHVGKSSIGWQFLFAPYPEWGLTSRRSWRAYLASRSDRIFDEYGDPMPLVDFEAMVAAKRTGYNAFTAPRAVAGSWDPAEYERLDEEGYRFSTTPHFC